MSQNEVPFSFMTEPVVKEFGPYRAIGMNYKGKNENQEIPSLWSGPDGFISRMKEVKPYNGPFMSFGLCRCIPGATDGSFEYIAAVPAADDAEIPEGMIEVQIPRCSYIVFPVRNLGELSQTWNATQGWFAAQSEWETYCGPTQGCDCANHPFFELYPAEFNGSNEMFLYSPVRKK